MLKMYGWALFNMFCIIWSYQPPLIACACVINNYGPHDSRFASYIACLLYEEISLVWLYRLIKKTDQWLNCSGHILYNSVEIKSIVSIQFHFPFLPFFQFSLVLNFLFSCVSYFREIASWPACHGGFVFSIRKSKTKKWPSLLNDDCWPTAFISKKWKICDIHCSTRRVLWFTKSNNIFLTPFLKGYWNLILDSRKCLGQLTFDWYCNIIWMWHV